MIGMKRTPERILLPVSPVFIAFSLFVAFILYNLRFSILHEAFVAKLLQY